MAKKIFLDVRPEPVYFTLIGISCHVKDYRISYLLNTRLGLEFHKLDDLKITLTQKKEPTGFSFYYYRDEDYFNAYYLISNRSEEFALAPEIKQVDFLLIVEGVFKKAQKDPLIKAIRAIPNVLTAYEINFAEIKNHETLLNDMEMHFMNIHKESKVKYQPKSKV
ncbi:MAG: IPExxxVDY family protein [Bacteroidetes bacterium]|nr:IPExxxVDY family protein [Bacteroidota bacterium]